MSPVTRIRTKKAAGSGSGGGGGGGGGPTVTYLDRVGAKDTQAWVISQDDKVGAKDSQAWVTTQPDAVGAKDTATITGQGVPYWLSVGTGGGSSAAGVTVTKPAGLAVGDLMLAFIGTAAAASSPAPITPAGWTQIYAAVIGLTGQVGYGACWKIADAADVAATNFTFAFTANADEFAGEIHRIMGFNTTTPINVNAAQAGALGLGNPADPPALDVTTTSTNCLIFAWLWHSHLALSQSHTPPANHTERTDFEVNLATVIWGMTSASRAFAASGLQAAVTFDCTETVNTDWVTLRIAVAPGPINIVL